MTPIILFVFDQLRAGAVGPAASRAVPTPHLDAFATTSVRFDTCITDAPLCRPARTSLVTGLSVMEHRVFDNQRIPAPHTMPSHVRELRDAGYRTAVVGKTHLHLGRGHLEQHRDTLAAWGYVDAIELPDAQDARVGSAYCDWLTMTTRCGQIDKARRWRDYVAHARPGDTPDQPPWSLEVEDHLDVFCARRAAEFVEQHHDDPLYLQVCFPGPHPPFDPPQAFVARVGELPAPLGGERSGPVTDLAIRYRQRQRRWSADDVDRMRRAYFGKVALLDHAFGLVMDAVRRTGLGERAWIVVTADHGELLGDHGYFGKVLPFESALRIPLLVRPPGGTQGWGDRGVTQLRDVTATVRSIAGLGSGALDRRALEGPRGELAHQTKSVPFACLGYTGLRTPETTMTWDRRFGRPLEFYDRGDDPQQLHNRVL